MDKSEGLWICNRFAGGNAYGGKVGRGAVGGGWEGRRSDPEGGREGWKGCQEEAS